MFHWTSQAKSEIYCPPPDGWRMSQSRQRQTGVAVTTLAVHLQRGNEGFLRDVDLAELPHLLLAFLLLFEKFSFAGDVAAVAFRGDVLAQRAHRLAGDHLAADGRLD